jgi:hypothetical protein
MRRFFIFLLLGPPIGWVLILIAVYCARPTTPEPVRGFFLWMPFAYILGILPALVGITVGSRRIV